MKSKKQFTDRTVNSLTDVDGTWWSKAKQLIEGPGKSQVQDTYLIEGENMSPTVLTQRLNQYFTTIGGEYETSVFVENSEVERTVHIGEVKQQLKKVNAKKSTSSEDFPSWISRDFHEELCVPLTDIINTMLRERHYPVMWKRAEVIPLKKVSSPSLCKEFRPISLLYHCGKIAEFFFTKELKKYLIPKIPEYQYAYQKNKGTTDALIYTLDRWTSMLDHKDNAYVEAILADFSKAFDRMQPKILVETLMKLDIPNDLILLANDFLHDRQQCVRLGKHKSSYAPIRVGVPQGTITGPIFWLAFVSTLNAPSPIENIIYADDTTFFWQVNNAEIAQSAIGQLCADYAVSWSSSNGMMLNATKTKVLRLSLKTCYNNLPTPMLGDTTLECVETGKFLGVTLDNHLLFKDHINETTSKAAKRLFCLLKLKQLGVSVTKLKLFYLAHIRSVLSYAAPAFYHTLSMTSKGQLEKIQNRATRIILPGIDSVTERNNVLDICFLSEFLNHLCAKKFENVLDESNTLHKLLPLKQSNVHRHSVRLADSFIVKARTTLRANSFIPYMCRK